jgi:hypothetical protein
MSAHEPYGGSEGAVGMLLEVVQQVLHRAKVADD